METNNEDAKSDVTSATGTTVKAVEKGLPDEDQSMPAEGNDSNFEPLSIHLDVTDQFSEAGDGDITTDKLVAREAVGAITDKFNDNCDLDGYNTQCQHTVEKLAEHIGTKNCKVCILDARAESQDTIKAVLNFQISELKHELAVQNLELGKRAEKEKILKDDIAELKGHAEAYRKLAEEHPTPQNVRDQFVDVEGQLFIAQNKIKTLIDEDAVKNVEITRLQNKIKGLQALNHTSQMENNELKHYVRNMTGDGDVPFVNIMMNQLKVLEEVACRVTALHKAVRPKSTVVYETLNGKICNRWWTDNGRYSPLDVQVCTKTSMANLQPYKVCYVKEAPHNIYSAAVANESEAFNTHLNGNYRELQRGLMDKAREINGRNPVGRRSQMRRAGFAGVGAETWPQYDANMAALAVDQRPIRNNMRNKGRSRSRSGNRQVFMGPPANPTSANATPLGARQVPHTRNGRRAPSATATRGSDSGIEADGDHGPTFIKSVVVRPKPT